MENDRFAGQRTMIILGSLESA